MRSIKRFGVALALAGVVAVGAASASVEAKGKNGSADSKDAICAYLLSVMTYEYVSPTVFVYAASLYSWYGCATP